VEVDVRLTADGVPMLLHDPWLVRTTLLPSRLAKVSADRVSRLTLRGGSEPPPTFAAALAAVLSHPTLGMAVDVKDPTAAEATVAAVDAARARGRVLLWSQHEPCVRHFAATCPDVEVALLRDTHSAASTQRMFDDAEAFGAQAVSIHWSMVQPDVLADAAGRGLLVYAWCKNQEAFANPCARDLRGLVTDWPAEMARERAGL
jgi:glycerophosphoryl diester phosphodiesterase